MSLSITLRKIVGLSNGSIKSTMLVSKNSVSFLGDVDVKTGVIVAEDSDLKGECVKGKIFAFPYGRGSTVGTYVLLQMKKLGTAPAMIINRKTESILVAGAVISDIPLADKPNPDLFDIIESKYVEVEVVDTGDKFLLNLLNF